MSADADFLKFWGLDEADESCRVREEGAAHPFDLEERTALFGEAIIRFAKQVPRNAVNNRLIDQLVGAGTSVGANYCEADDAFSRKEYALRIATCRKEARETKFFLRMIAVSEPALKPDARVLWKEARELHLIFCSIFRKVSPERVKRPEVRKANKHETQNTKHQTPKPRRTPLSV